MNLKDLKHKVEKEDSVNIEKDVKATQGFVSMIAPFVMKNVTLLLAILFSVIFYFIYAAFAHTKEVLITFLIAGAYSFLLKLYRAIQSYNNDSENIINKGNNKK